MKLPPITPGRWVFERMPSAEEFAQLKGETLAEHEGYFRDNGGDWIVTFRDDNAGEDGIDGGRIAGVSFKGKAKRGDAWKAPDPEGQANARAIGAVPDMLQALVEGREELVRLRERYGTAHSETVIARLEQALRAAGATDA